MRLSRSFITLVRVRNISLVCAIFSLAYTTDAISHHVPPDSCKEVVYMLPAYYSCEEPMHAPKLASIVISYLELSASDFVFAIISLQIVFHICS